MERITPTQALPMGEAFNASFSDYVGDTLNALANIDIIALLRVFIFWLLFIWLVFAFWVSADAIKRYKHWIWGIFWFIFILPFNFLGLLLYLFVRPVYTNKEREWTDLEAKYLLYELSAVNECPSCKTIIPMDYKFCPVCGFKMFKICKNCKTEQTIFNSYCHFCGAEFKSENILMNTMPQRRTEKVLKESVAGPDIKRIERIEQVERSNKNGRVNNRESSTKRKSKPLNLVLAEFVESVGERVINLLGLFKSKK